MSNWWAMMSSLLVQLREVLQFKKYKVTSFPQVIQGYLEVGDYSSERIPALSQWVWQQLLTFGEVLQYSQAQLSASFFRHNGISVNYQFMRKIYLMWKLQKACRAASNDFYKLCQAATMHGAWCASIEKLACPTRQPHTSFCSRTFSLWSVQQ